MNDLMKFSTSYLPKQTMRLARVMLIGVTTILLQSCSTQPISSPAPLSPEAIRSSLKLNYQCHSEPVFAMHEEGDSKDAGCYFILHNPQTGEVMPRTRYLLEIRKPNIYDPYSNPEVSVTGTTDKLGRSQFVRVPFPIDTYGMRFVEIVGKGEFNAGFTADFNAGREGRRPQWSAAYNYRLSINGKAVYSSVTDLNGRTVVFESPTSDKITVDFFREKH
jgi:hypothetical protein